MSAPSLPTRTLICIMGLVAALAPAQDFQKAATAAQTDLDKALADYGRVTQEIADAKIPLARKLNELEAEVADKRREASKSQGARDSGTLELNTLKTQVNARQDEIGYLSSLLGEYVRAFEARVHISELQRYHDLLQQAKDVAADQTLDPSQRFEKQIAVVKASLDRALKLMGGDTFDGHALSPKGTMEEGRFALIGPVGLFSSKQSPAKGIVEFVRGSTEPTVIQIGPQFDAGIELRANLDHRGFRRAAHEFHNALGGTLLAGEEPHGSDQGKPAFLHGALRAQRVAVEGVAAHELEGAIQRGLHDRDLLLKPLRRVERLVGGDVLGLLQQIMIALQFGNVNASFKGTNILAQKTREVADLILAGVDLRFQRVELQGPAVSRPLGLACLAPLVGHLRLQFVQLAGERDLGVGDFLGHSPVIGERLVEIGLGGGGGLLEVLGGGKGRHEAHDADEGAGRKRRSAHARC